MASPPPGTNQRGGGSRTTDLNSIWEDLQQGITQIYAEKSVDMSKNRYIELYT